MNNKNFYQIDLVHHNNAYFQTNDLLAAVDEAAVKVEAVVVVELMALEEHNALLQHIHHQKNHNGLASM